MKFSFYKLCDLSCKSTNKTELENKQNFKIHVLTKIRNFLSSNLEFRGFNPKFRFSTSKYPIGVIKLGGHA